MRKASLGLALLATVQLSGVLSLSTPAYADDAAAPVSNSSKTTGWILLGGGTALGIGGVIVDAVGTNQGHVAGAGGPGGTSETDTTRYNFYLVGSAMIVVGAIAAIYGGSLLVNGTTDKPPAALPGNDEARASDGATKGAQARLSSSPSFVVPVLGATF